MYECEKCLFRFLTHFATCCSWWGRYSCQDERGYCHNFGKELWHILGSFKICTLVEELAFLSSLSSCLSVCVLTRLTLILILIKVVTSLKNLCKRIAFTWQIKIKNLFFVQIISVFFFCFFPSPVFQTPRQNSTLLRKESAWKTEIIKTEIFLFAKRMQYASGQINTGFPLIRFIRHSCNGNYKS